MRRKVKPDLNAIERGVNPFVINHAFKIKVNSLTRYNKNGDKHEVEFESQQYTKVFRSSAMRSLVVNLSPASKSILFWIIYSIEKTRHCVWLDRQRVMRECGMVSDNTLRGAIKDLIDVGVISLTSHQSVYWINPSIFFCGSRINKYPDKVV